jgi:hypothetical protein
MAELTKRYVVMSLATEAPFDLRDHDGPFVLKPWKDPAALSALETYRDHCYSELARDLDVWIRTIKAGPAVRGGVGRRNEPFTKAALPAGGPRPRPGAKPKPKSKAKAARKKGKRR